MQVQSQAQHSGLRIWHGRSYGLGHNYGLDLIPGQELHVPWSSQERKKKKSSVNDTYLAGLLRKLG